MFISSWRDLQVLLPPLASLPSLLRTTPTTTAQPQLQPTPPHYGVNSSSPHSTAAPAALPTAEGHATTDLTLWGGPAELTMGSTCSSTDESSSDDRNNSDASGYFISEADFLMHEVRWPYMLIPLTDICTHFCSDCRQHMDLMLMPQSS